MEFPFKLPYRETRDGYWGAHTSTINWCEEDYSMSYYCAEVVNTTTNLLFVYLAVRGILQCIKYSHPPIYILTLLGYLTIGIGSMAFHTTLKYSMQLADELPMIYTICITCYATWSCKKSWPVCVGIALTMVAAATSITVYYLQAKNPVFHQAAFAVILCSTVFHGMYVMEHTLRPALEKRSPELADDIMDEMWKFVKAGSGHFLLAFFLWNMDNIFCGNLQGWRNQVLLPWSVLFENHGWWHIFTGISGYYLIIWLLWVDTCISGREQEFMLRWPSYWSPNPDVVPRPARPAGSLPESGKKRA